MKRQQVHRMLSLFAILLLGAGTAFSQVTFTYTANPVSCFGASNGALTITASGGSGPYTYSINNGASFQSSNVFTGLSPATYQVQVMDVLLDVSPISGAVVTQPAAIATTVAAQTNVSCFGGSNGAASINTPTGGTGPYSYNWTPGNPTGDGTTSVTGLSAGSWTVTVTDANFCTATRVFSITQPSAISATAAAQTNVSCFGGSNGTASINTPTGGAGGYSYNWTPGNPIGDGTTSVIGLFAGTWTVTVTDANSCTATRTFSITQPATGITTTAAAQTNVSCFGGSNGAASINIPTGGTPPYTYNWTPGNPTGDGTTSVTGLSAGTWTVTVTDANSCTAARTFAVTQPSALSVTPASQTNVSCFGGSNGAATINAATGGTGGYSYNWTPGNPTGDGTTSVTGLTASTWTVTVTDANACTATQTFTVTQPSAIVANAASQTNVSCFGGANGAAAINAATGGAGGYSYNWTPGNPTGDGTTSVTGLTAGSWTVTVTDANACTATRVFAITQPSALSVTPASQTDIACFGGSTGAAAINAATGGAGGYSYNWTPGNPTGDGTTSVTGLSAGTWTVTVTDANACTATQTFAVGQPTTALSVTPSSQTNVSCFGGSNGAASINAATGGTAPYTYNWTPGNPTGDGTTSVTGLSVGTWTVTVTDAYSCTAIQTFTVTQPSAIVANAASQTNVSCFGGSNGAASIVAFGGAGGYTYNWTPGNPTGDGTASVTGLSAGTWTVTVTDANACTATQTFTVTQPSAIAATPVSQTNVSCFGGSNGAASIVASGGAGGYTYDWTPGTPTGDGTASVTGLTAGSWTVTVTDANSCTATRTFTITQPSALVTTPASLTNVSCFGGANGAASINAATGGAAPYSYNWTPGNPVGDGTTSVTGLTAGTWTVTVTDANACTATQTFTVTQPSAIVANTASQTNVSCFGGANGAASITAATGGAAPYSYNWTPGNPVGDGTTSVTGLTAGSWTVTVTDANSCTVTRTFAVTQPSAIVVTPSAQTNIACFGGANGAASINAATGGTPPYTYNWTPGNPVGDGTTSVTGLTAGAWTVTVTDANACTATQIFTITQPTALVATPAAQTNIACFGGANGAASINAATGGAAPYSYNWTPGNPVGDGTTSVTGLTAGTWTVTVTDANACTVAQTFTVTQPTALVATPAAQTNVSCFGGNNGAASINTPTGGTAPYTYDWTPGNPTGDGTASVTGLTAGTWTVTVTDANACTATQTFTITQSSTLAVTPASQTNVSCFGGANGAASINTPTGGTAPYTYDWTPGNPTGDGTASVTGLTAGTWTVTVTDANACSTTQTFTITQPTAVVATAASQTNLLCNGAATGAASVTASGGTGALTYDWTPGNPTGDGTASVTGLTAGTWTVTVSDANACTATETFTITEPPVITITPGITTNASCFGASDGTASVTASGGTGALSYDWTPGIPTGDGTNSVTGLIAGIWTISVTDANACVVSQNITITEPTLLVASSGGQVNVTCNGNATGTATVTATGGTGAYTYLWSNGQTTPTAIGLAAGAYTATVTDVNGCTAIQSFTITQPSALTVQTSSQQDILCFGGTGSATVAVVGGTGAITYDWTPGNPTGDGTNTVTGLAPGAWVMTATDANGCVATQTFNILQPALLTVAPATQTNVNCNGGANGTASVTVAGGTGTMNYNWTPGNPIGDGTNSVSGLTAGTWTVTVTDANGCIATQTMTITQPPALIASSVAQSNVSCNSGSNGSATVSATGGTGVYTYSWMPTGGTAATASGLVAGTYTATVTDANSCTATQIFNITQPTPIVVTPTGQTNVACNGAATGAASIVASGGSGTLTYNWTPGNPAGDGTNSVTGLTAGTWTVTVTDGNGCTATQTFNIIQLSGLTTSISGQTNVSCFGGNNGVATVNVSGGTGPGTYSYSWAPGTGNAATVTSLSANTYTVTVVDANLCSTTQTVVITEPTQLVTAPSQTNVTCNGANDGIATVTASGGTGPYTYQWFPSGGTAATATGLVPGTYNVVTTDNNGCTISNNFTITEPATLVATAASQTEVSCFGGSNGVATVSVTGGTMPYDYSWAPTGGTAATASGLTAGTYTATITDDNGCVATQTFTITEPTLLVATAASQTNVSCNGGSDAVAIVGVTGGTVPYTYSWAPTGGTDDTATGLVAGTYTVTVTDDNGCVTTQGFNITEPPVLAPSIASQTNVDCNGNTTGAVTVSVTGGTGAYTYSWAPTGGTAATATGLAAGSYTLTVTDANNCVATQSVTITQPAVLIGTPSQTNLSCNMSADGTATVSVAGGTMPYIYSWAPTGGSAATATGLVAGTYTVTVTDDNGCVITNNYTITEPDVLTVSMASNVPCPGDTLHLSSTIAGGTIPYTFSWTGANGFTSSMEDTFIANVTNAAAGSYSISIVDDNGCTAVANGTVIVNDTVLITAQPIATSACIGSPAGFSVTATGTGLTYQWRANGVNIVNGGVYSGATTSALNISDAAGLNNTTYDVIITGTCTADTSVGVILGTPTFNTWTGVADTAWSNAANWQCGNIPNIDIDVIIPSTAPHMPLVDIPGAVAHSITISSGGSLAFVGTGNQLEVKGDITGAGTFNAAIGAVVLSGNNPQSFPGGTYKLLKVDGGDVKSIQGNVIIASNLMLIDGYLALGAHNLTMTGAALLTGGSETSFVITDGVGQMSVNNMGVGGNIDPVLFPVGTEVGVYLPATISNAGTTDIFSVRVIDDVYNEYSNNIPSGAALTENVVDKTWIITESADGGSNANVSLSWTGSEELVGFINIECNIAHFNETNSVWEPGVVGAATNNAGRFTISRPNVNVFSPFCVRTEIDPTGIIKTPVYVYGLVVYPNPVSDNRLFIRMENQSMVTAMDIAVLDITGRVVSSQHYNAGSYRPDNIEMNIGDLAAGNYTLKLKQEGATMQAVKFIKR